MHQIDEHWAFKFFQSSVKGGIEAGHGGCQVDEYANCQSFGVYVSYKKSADVMYEHIHRKSLQTQNRPLNPSQPSKSSQAYPLPLNPTKILEAGLKPSKNIEIGFANIGRGFETL